MLAAFDFFPSLALLGQATSRGRFFHRLTAPRKARSNSGPAGKGRDMALNVSAPRERTGPSKNRPHAVNRCAIPQEGAYRVGRGGGWSRGDIPSRQSTEK
jgi:hypothetical protein